MKNREYNVLLSEAMLLPFIETDFNNLDAINRYAVAYNDIIRKDNFFSQNIRQKVRQEFNDSKEKLVDFLAKDIRWKHIDDILRFLDMFFPGYKLVKFIDKDNNDIGRFYLNYILELSRVFVTFRDGLISIRNWSKSTDPFLNKYDEFEKIDLWNQISRTVTTDLFIAAAYVNFDVDINNMFNVPNLVYLADMPLKVILNKGVAETHMHANAGISYQSVWESVISFEYNKKKTSDLWFCTLFRFFSSLFIFEKSDSNFINFILNDIDDKYKLEWFNDYIREDEHTLITSTEINEYRENIQDLFGIEVKGESDVLFSTFFSGYQNRGCSSEIIWYYSILRYLKCSYDSSLCKLFLKYIRLKNYYFRNKIQATKIRGLDYFQPFYNNSTDTEHSKGKKKYYSIFEEQCKTGNLMILEMKISPKIGKSSTLEDLAIDNIKRKTLLQIQQIIGAYKDYICDQEKIVNESEIKFPLLGLIYHFIKNDDSDNFSGFNCSIIDRSNIYDCKDYNTMRKNSMRFITALNQLLEEYPLLTDYVVGIDAASIENQTEPWVYAPVFRAARTHKKMIPYSVKKGANIQNIGFTYHVGEDFRHIISGLRHIDEILKYYDYRSGDRLGHAIALGVDIDNMVSHNSIVSIPIMEYLENLLWMWQYANTSGEFGKISENLEFKIMEIAKQIYKSNMLGIDAYLLWRVYQAKFNILSTHISSLMKKDKSCGLRNKLIDGTAWNFEELLCTHYCPCFYEIYNKPIFVSMDDNIQFYKELQRSLIEKVERMGVYVETNPSSNAAIGDIPSILDHPILRLNNRGLSFNGSSNSCVLTTINSDDPIVFSTFAENEIAYVYYSLLNAGCKREEALEWIDKIRKHGLNSSFIKNKKNFDYRNMKKDFEEILKYVL